MEITKCDKCRDKIDTDVEVYERVSIWGYNDNTKDKDDDDVKTYDFCPECTYLFHKLLVEFLNGD